MQAGQDRPVWESSASGSTTVRPARITADGMHAFAVGSSKSQTHTTKQRSTISGETSTSASNGSAGSAVGTSTSTGPRTKASARRARRKVLEARYAPNLPSPTLAPISGAAPSKPKTAMRPAPLSNSSTASTTGQGDIHSTAGTGTGLIGKKKKTRRSGIKARRRVENAQNREVEAVEAALDELDLNGSDDDVPDAREFFRTNKTSPVKTKTAAPVSSPPAPKAKAAMMSPPRTSAGLRPLRTHFAAQYGALATATSTPLPAPAPSRSAATLAPAPTTSTTYPNLLGTPSMPRSLLLGTRLAGLTGSLDPFASRVGLTPRLPSPSPAATAVFRAASPIPASPASSAGLRLAWEEGSSYLSSSADLSFDATSPTLSETALREEEGAEGDNTRDEIIDVEEGNDTTLDEDEVDELSILGMDADGHGLEEFGGSMAALEIKSH